MEYIHTKSNQMQVYMSEFQTIETLMKTDKKKSNKIGQQHRMQEKSQLFKVSPLPASGSPHSTRASVSQIFDQKWISDGNNTVRKFIETKNIVYKRNEQVA